MPVSEVKTNPDHLRILENWMRSYRSEELFDEQGRFRLEYASLAPEGVRRMGSNPNSNGGRLTVDLVPPDFTAYQVKLEKRAHERLGLTAVLRQYLRDVYKANPHNFWLFSPDETNSNRLGAVFEVSDRCLASICRRMRIASCPSPAIASRSRNNLNLIVIDKQLQFQWLTMEEAEQHCARGAGVWDMYGNQPEQPDIVLACAGDIPTQETIAAAWMLRQFLPELNVRVVNLVDLMRLCPTDRHPHGTNEAEFTEVFTATAPVIFAFHGYPGVIHDLLHGRSAHDRFHVRGYVEEGTTTTPFDMVVLNKMSRLHICLDVPRYVTGLLSESVALIDRCNTLLSAHELYIRDCFDDLPEIRDWVWTD